MNLTYRSAVLFRLAVAVPVNAQTYNKIFAILILSSLNQVHTSQSLTSSFKNISFHSRIRSHEFAIIIVEVWGRDMFCAKLINTYVPQFD